MIFIASRREANVNAIRHSGATKIAVDICYEVRQLRVCVQDDGCGIDSQVLKSGRERSLGIKECANVPNESTAN